MTADRDYHICFRMQCALAQIWDRARIPTSWRQDDAPTEGFHFDVNRESLPGIDSPAMICGRR